MTSSKENSLATHIPLASSHEFWRENVIGIYFILVFSHQSLLYKGFPGGTVVKNPPVNSGDTRDVGSISGLGRFPGRGNGNPLQYSYLENPMDRGAWQVIVHGLAKSRTWLSDWAQHTPMYNLGKWKLYYYQVKYFGIYLDALLYKPTQISKMTSLSKCHPWVTHISAQEKWRHKKETPCYSSGYSAKYL